MADKIEHSLEEYSQLQRAFRYFMKAYIKLVFYTAKDKPNNWPAMQGIGCVTEFVLRNLKHAREPNNPVYWKQPIDRRVDY